MTINTATILKNISGKLLTFSFLPPHGRELAANEEVTIDGDIYAFLHRNPRALRSFQSAISSNLISIVSSPSTDDDGARSYLVGRQFQQQFIDNATDVYGITLSGGGGSVVMTVGLTDSTTREPIPFTDVTKVGLKMITNNDGSAVIKINGVIVTAGGAIVEVDVVDGVAVFTISVTGAAGGSTQTFDSQDVQSNGLGTDTATLTLT